jgi:purine-binding chemotaxis protein CheW
MNRQDEARWEAIYQERARQLASQGLGMAQTGAGASSKSKGKRVLVFGVGEERYALEFADLREMLPFANWTPVPGGPACLLGVINVQGEIRSVIDLGCLLELPKTVQATGGYVLVVRKGNRCLALRVDRLDQVQSVNLEDGGLPGKVDVASGFRYLQGVSADGIRLLSTEALLGKWVPSSDSKGERVR